MTDTAILAAAGSRKTEHIIDSALAIDSSQRVLITTYTNQNQHQILSRIVQKAGIVPANITVLGWFTFLISQCAKPYQRALTGHPLVINGLNFKGQRSRYIKKTDVRHYYFDKNADMHRDGVSAFVVELNKATGKAVISRLERVYSHVFVDEVQDLVGYDLDVLDLLLASSVTMTLVGDPRQHIIETNVGNRNDKYRGVGMLDWFAERRDTCEIVVRNESYRCNQDICDFADEIFPALPRTTSIGVETTGHDGVREISRDGVAGYLAQHPNVTILRHSKRSNTLGLPAMNFGIAKGSTFERVLIFPTGAMRKYLKSRVPSDLTEPEKLYVAVTRARWSVTFVID